MINIDDLEYFNRSNRDKGFGSHIPFSLILSMVRKNNFRVARSLRVATSKKCQKCQKMPKMPELCQKCYLENGKSY